MKSRSTGFIRVVAREVLRLDGFDQRTMLAMRWFGMTTVRVLPARGRCTRCRILDLLRTSFSGIDTAPRVENIETERRFNIVQALISHSPLIC